MSKDKKPNDYQQKVSDLQWEHRGFLASPKIKPEPKVENNTNHGSTGKPDTPSDK